MSSIVKHTNVKVIAEKASSTHETHFLQLNDQLELKVSDDDLLTQLTSLDGNLVDIETILNTQTVELTAIKTNTANIKASIEIGGDLYVSQDEVEAKLQSIHDRQDDILTSNNATKLTNATIATKITSLQSDNHTDLVAINSRQDDVLSAVNNSSTKSNTIDSNLLAHKIANNTHLTNIYSRQDAILTSANATKLAVQALQVCKSGNELQVDLVGIGDVATESTLSSVLSDTNTIAENFTSCDTDNVTIVSSVLPSGASTSTNQTTINSSVLSLGLPLAAALVNTAFTNTKLDNILLKNTEINLAVDENKAKLILNTTAIDENKAEVILNKGLLGDIKAQQLIDNIVFDNILIKNTAIHNRQDDILTSNNATKLTNATIATKITSLQSDNHTDLVAINSRQDDVLTAVNNSSTKSNTIDSNLLAHKIANNTHLTNIYSRQDAILTSANATKLAVQALQVCKSGNELQVDLVGIGDVATESTLSSVLSDTNTIAENFTSCDTNELEATLELILSKNTEINLAVDENKAKLILNTTAIDENKAEVILNKGLLGDIKAQQIIDNAVLDVIAAKQILATTSEVKEVLSSSTINALSLSSEIDTENYEHVFLYGSSTASVGNNLTVYASNVSGGTYYNLGLTIRDQTVIESGGAVFYLTLNSSYNLPRFIKIFNKHGSTNFTINKLYLQGSGGRLAV